MEDRSKSSARSTARRRPAKAAMAAASSPAVDPMSMFNNCGHDNCPTHTCNVRYVGPVSHVRDHHALHAARGVAHVWTAAIVSGLAVVLTGVLAYNAAQAQTRRATGLPTAQSADIRMMMERLDRLETMMRNVAERCAPAVGMDEAQNQAQLQVDRAEAAAAERQALIKKQKLNAAGSAVTQ